MTDYENDHLGEHVEYSDNSSSSDAHSGREHKPSDESGSDKDASADDEEESPEDRRKAKRQKLIVICVLALLALLAIIAGLIWWLNARHWENTDDAYVDTKITRLAPRASGAVLGVFVADNQQVHAGQLLIQLDDSAARTQLAQAEASRAQSLSQIAQAQAQVQVSSNQVEEAQADTRGPAAQAGKSLRDYRRYSAVHDTMPGAVALQQLDQSRSTATNDAASFESARKKVKTSRAQLSSSRTQIDAGLAQLRTSEAQIAQARLQIAYARVVAPVDGHIANETVAIGDYAQPGQQLLSVVPNRLWITANYKETQLEHVHVGQRVELRIDAYPGTHFTGRVQSIQRGAGQTFAVLPAQNATGNFVKVVQRVPVKIVLDRFDTERFPIGPGMSVVPSVRID